MHYSSDTNTQLQKQCSYLPADELAILGRRRLSCNVFDIIL